MRSRRAVRRAIPKNYTVHERALAADDLTNFEGIPVVTARRAILDGIERHLDARLLDQAVDTAQRRGLLLAHELDSIEEERR